MDFTLHTESTLLLYRQICEGLRREIVLGSVAAGIEGENMRPVTWVVVEEVKSGDWGIAGQPLTTTDVKALAAGKA